MEPQALLHESFEASARVNRPGTAASRPQRALPFNHVAMLIEWHHQHHGVSVIIVGALHFVTLELTTRTLYSTIFVAIVPWKFNMSAYKPA